MSDRLIQQGDFLFGVRFGTQTNYCLLDIDIHSPYHPNQDPFAISRIVAAMEAIGLVSYIACTSSYSKGIHLYFPFEFAQNSWELASVVSILLERSGFALKPGQLELFPNPKPYTNNFKPNLFNAHRLPLQTGSYLLNQDFQPVWSNQTRFVEQWHLVQAHNAIDQPAIKRILKQSKRKYLCLSGKANKFINDLNTEIELGWTGFGQTNRLLGRITMRTYIFHHILEGGKPLVGESLVQKIVEIARSLPGYQEWCRHQHEIEHRAEEWVRCIENSHYFHYTTEKRQPVAQSKTVPIKVPSWNEQQSESARERIRQAIANLLETCSLPSGATARFKALIQFGIGGGSLYRHKDLWHPSFIELIEPSTEMMELNKPIPVKPFQDCFVNPLESNTETRTGIEQFSIQSNANATSLLLGVGGNVLQDRQFSDRVSQDFDLIGGNTLIDQRVGHLFRYSESEQLCLVLEQRQDVEQKLQAIEYKEMYKELQALLKKYQAAIEYGADTANRVQFLLEGLLQVCLDQLVWFRDAMNGLGSQLET